MATISNTPRPGYVWDSTDNCWYPIGVGAHSHNEIPKTIVDAKGDLIVGTAADTVDRLAVGTDGQALIADSTQTKGVKWGTAGAVVQVKSASLTSTVSTTSTSYVDVTGLSVSITPTSASNKIYVIATLPSIADSTGGTTYGTFQMLRGSTVISGFAVVGWYVASGTGGQIIGEVMAPASLSVLDSPATTSATTYKIQYKQTGGTIFAQSGSGTGATITVMEVTP